MRTNKEYNKEVTSKIINKEYSKSKTKLIKELNVIISNIAVRSKVSKEINVNQSKINTISKKSLCLTYSTKGSFIISSVCGAFFSAFNKIKLKLLRSQG
jgi:ribonuclease D